MGRVIDDMAFYVPFYFQDAIKYDKGTPDLRDKKHYPAFRAVRDFFYKEHVLDEGFVGILKSNEEWINEISETRNFLIHNFHDLSLNSDCWTDSYYVFFYEFHNIKSFIPNALTYVAKMYFNFVKFTKDYEEHFKRRCQGQFPEFEYFEGGHATSSGLGKTHLFYAGLGKLLEDKILIRIHSGRRKNIPKVLEYFMREEGIVCESCDLHNFKIQPTVEHYVKISAFCGCGNPLPIPSSIEKKFFPYFMDQNRKHVIDRLIPYDLKIKMLKFVGKAKWSS